MIGLVIVTHGRLAEEFKLAMEHVVGPQERVVAVCIGPEDDMEKRRRDILRQAGVTSAGEIAASLVEPGAEAALADALAAAEQDVAPLALSRDYVGLLKRLAALRDPVDRFFDAVMVMAEDPAKRANRLHLLGRLRGLFLRVADISLLPAATG